MMFEINKPKAVDPLREFAITLDVAVNKAKAAHAHPRGIIIVLENHIAALRSIVATSCSHVPRMHDASGKRIS